MAPKKRKKPVYKETVQYRPPVFSCAVGPFNTICVWYDQKTLPESQFSNTTIFPEVWMPSIDILEELRQEDTDVNH